MTSKLPWPCNRKGMKAVNDKPENHFRWPSPAWVSQLRCRSVPFADRFNSATCRQIVTVRLIKVSEWKSRMIALSFLNITITLKVCMASITTVCNTVRQHIEILRHEQQHLASVIFGQYSCHSYALGPSVFQNVSNQCDVARINRYL